MDEHGGSELARVEQELTAAAAARSQRDRLRAVAEELAAQERAAATAIEAARARRAEADHHRHDLEGVSIARILAGLRGVRDAELSREEAAGAAAEQEAAAAVRRRDATLVRQQQVQVELAGLGQVDAAWEQALAAKEALVGALGLAIAGPVTATAEARGRVEAEQREVAEAQEAAAHAAEVLDAASRALGSASSWSTYDTWFGGGMFSSAVKHERIDETAALLRRADRALDRLSAELADLGRSGIEAISVRPSTRTFDIFLDNIFSDVKVASQIQTGLERVDATRRRVGELRQELADRAEQLGSESEALAAQRAELLSRPV